MHKVLGTADIAEFLAERGVHVDPSSVFDGVQRFIPLYKEAARPRCHRVDARWAVDETYIRLAGRWVYAYRAINKHDQMIDVYLSEARDTEAAGPRSCATSRCLELIRAAEPRARARRTIDARGLAGSVNDRQRQR